MEVKEVLEKLNLVEDDLDKGDLIAESQCEVCDKTFGYILIRRNGGIAYAYNLVVLDGYECPKPGDKIKCLCCGEEYRHIQDLFTKVIYRES